jgi:exopolysaccharide biosynthesis protein
VILNKQGIITANTLNVRESYSATAKIVNTINKDTKIDIIEEKDGWYRIGEGQWVSGKYVEIVTNKTVEKIVEKDKKVVEVAKPVVKTNEIKVDTPIRKYEITKTKDGINIVKIKKEHLKKIDVILGNQPKETLSSIYKRLNPKPSFILNGGLFAVNNGNSMSSMFDEGIKVVSGYFSDFGLYIKQDGTYGFDNFNNVKDIRDFLGASPTLIIDGVRNVDLKGLTKDKAFTDVRHPRTCIAMDNEHFYIIVIDGRRLGKRGMTVNELVEFGLKMKLQFMVNLDGGGSSMLLDADGKSINSPTENRAIDNAIAFYL